MEHALHVYQLAGRVRARRRRLGSRQRRQEAVHQRHMLPAHAAGLHSMEPLSLLCSAANGSQRLPRARCWAAQDEAAELFCAVLPSGPRHCSGQGEQGQ